MVLFLVATWVGAPAAAAADCAADQELLGLLRWVDHVAARGARVDPGDVAVLDARYRGLMASGNMARLAEAGHLRKGEAVPQLLGLTESILAKGQIQDVDTLNGVLQAVYLQLSDECEQELGSTLKDWVVDSREMIEDDVKAPGNGASEAVAAPSATKVAGLVMALAALIGATFILRVLWIWISALIIRRRGCRIGCDLVIGDYRFQGFITVLARTACRFEFPQSTINDFRAALSKTTNCTVAIGGSDIAGEVLTLRPSSLRIDFQKPLDRRNLATILARSLGPVLRDRQTTPDNGAARPGRDGPAPPHLGTEPSAVSEIPGPTAQQTSAAR